MVLQYKKVGPWRDYLFGERMYIILSFVTKTVLAWFTQATLEKLKTLRLYGMERSFRTLLESGGDRALSSDELMAQVTDAEYDERHERRTKRLVKNASFRLHASFPEIDFSLDCSLDRTVFLRLADCEWIKAARTIVISGPTGSGKSYLSHALGYQACSLGCRTLYFNCTKLFLLFKEKRNVGSYQRQVARIARTPLLILDDFGLSPLDAQDRLSLLELIEDRLGKAATLSPPRFPSPSGLASLTTRSSLTRSAIASSRSR
jgi:DNA replication protein DnaC